MIKNFTGIGILLTLVNISCPSVAQDTYAEKSGFPKNAKVIIFPEKN
jgi:hypothetical protein